LIEMDNVTKSFVVRRRTGRLRRVRTAVRACEDISFTVRAGEFVGYLGPNGAGKSTTIKMLTGILTPTSGSVVVAGLDPSRQRTTLARRIGVVFGQRTTLWWDLPLRDSLALVRHLYRVEAGAHRARLRTLVDLLDLGPFLDTPVRQLSLGQRMRGDLAAALLHDPELLVLDEPTIGLDVVTKATVRAFLARLNAERGTTILLTTHDLGDIERLCRRVMIIDRGRLAYDGNLDRLRAAAGAERMLVVELERPAPPMRLPGARFIRAEGPRQWLGIGSGVNAASVVAAVTARHAVADIALREPDIEDVVARLYRRGIRGAVTGADGKAGREPGPGAEAAGAESVVGLLHGFGGPSGGAPAPGRPRGREQREAGEDEDAGAEQRLQPVVEVAGRGDIAGEAERTPRCQEEIDAPADERQRGNQRDHGRRPSRHDDDAGDEAGGPHERERPVEPGPVGDGMGQRVDGADRARRTPPRRTGQGGRQHDAEEKSEGVP
jgi:ABC-2 type transport system ATP-binding protein